MSELEISETKGNNPKTDLPQVQLGCRLQVSYRITLQEDGRLLEASADNETVLLEMGEGHWPIQVELALLGLSIGEQAVVPIGASEQAFGAHDGERIQRLPLTDFQNRPPQIGALIQFDLPNDDAVEGLVTEIKNNEVVVDFNHPYVGRDLSFEVSIVGIEASATEQVDAEMQA